MWLDRWVSKTVDSENPGPRSTIGTKTAAEAGGLLLEVVSLSTSGCQMGGCAKRAFSAAGIKCADGTAGIS